MDIDRSFEELRVAAATFPTRTMGALVFPGFQALDLWGPLEVFGDCAPAVRPLLIGRDGDPVASAQGPRVVPDVTFETAPRLDLLLIPGGSVKPLRGDLELLEWIVGQAADAELVMTVCNGSDLLAATGLLDGRRATTNKALFREIAAANPTVMWVPKARWVEDGKYVTASGISAGIDMALGVVARLAGESVADGLAMLVEYERQRDPSHDPFAEIHGLGEPTR